MTWLSSDVCFKFLFVKRFAIQVAWMSTDLWFKWFWLSILVVTEHGQEKHVIYRNLCVIDLDVRWLGIQAIWLSFDLRFKWFGCQPKWDSQASWCQLIWGSCTYGFQWTQEFALVSRVKESIGNLFSMQMFWVSIDSDSSDVVVRWSVIQVIGLSIAVWFVIQVIYFVWLISDWSELTVNWCVIRMFVVVNWFELQVICLSTDWSLKWVGGQLISDLTDSFVNRLEIQVSWLSLAMAFVLFEIQVRRLSIDSRFKWLGCQLRCDSNIFKWFWLLSDLRFNWVGCQQMCDSNDLGCWLIWVSIDVVCSRFKIQKI